MENNKDKYINLISEIFKCDITAIDTIDNFFYKQTSYANILKFIETNQLFINILFSEKDTKIKKNLAYAFKLAYTIQSDFNRRKNDFIKELSKNKTNELKIDGFDIIDRDILKKLFESIVDSNQPIDKINESLPISMTLDTLIKAVHEEDFKIGINNRMFQK